MNAKIDVSNVVLETNRLILRAWKPSDLDDFYEYAKVEEVGKMAGWKPHESKGDSMKILQMFIEEKKTFAIVYKPSGKVIGSLGIEKYGSEDELTEFFACQGREIGYVLSKDYWGQGLMPEAVRTVIDYLFNVLDYDFLLCGYFPFNKQSKRVQEKCGFTPYRECLFRSGDGSSRPVILNLLTNPKKNIEFRFSHPETLLIKQGA